MPDFILHSGTAIKVARIFIIRYDTPSGNFDAEESASDEIAAPIAQCMTACDLHAQNIRKRFMVEKKKPLEKPSFDHLPMTVPRNEVPHFLGTLLDLTEHYDRLIQTVDSAWISGVLPRKERSTLIRHWEGRILSTAARCWKTREKVPATNPNSKANSGLQVELT